LLKKKKNYSKIMLTGFHDDPSQILLGI